MQFVTVSLRRHRQSVWRSGEERFHRLNGRLRGLEVHQLALEDSERRTREELRHRDAEIGGLQEQLRQTRALIREMESTKAWRFHQWWQRRKP